MIKIEALMNKGEEAAKTLAKAGRRERGASVHRPAPGPSPTSSTSTSSTRTSSARSTSTGTTSTAATSAGTHGGRR